MVVVKRIWLDNLAGTILSLCAQQMPTNWERGYGYRPLLFATRSFAELVTKPPTGLSGRDAGSGPDGPASRGSRAPGETDLRLPSLSRRAAANHTSLRPGLDPVDGGVT